MPESLEWACTQRPGSHLQAGIQSTPRTAHQPDHDGQIIEYMRKDDGREGSNDHDRRSIEVEDTLQDQVDPPARTDQALKPAATTTVGRMNGMACQCPDKGPSPELESVKDISRR